MSECKICKEYMNWFTAWCNGNLCYTCKKVAYNLNEKTKNEKSRKCLKENPEMIDIAARAYVR